MSPGYNGWQDDEEEEREALGFPSEDAEEPWRGDEHPDTWPEHLAGPEYWLHKRDQEEGQ